MATLRWGILGCGDVAEYKGGPPLYSVDDSELVAVMRRDHAKAEAFAERHGAKRVYTDVDALLADDALNAIYVATPPYLHCEHVIRTAEAGEACPLRKTDGDDGRRVSTDGGCLPRCRRYLDARLLSELLSEYCEDEGVDA